MKRFFQLVAALIGGAVAGAIVGVLAGMIWTIVFQTSNFEGYAGMLVFFGFAPAGAIVGAITGAALLARAIQKSKGAALRVGGFGV